MVTDAFLWCSFTENAEKNPAAPPPIIATLMFEIDLLIYKSQEKSPHAMRAWFENVELIKSP